MTKKEAINQVYNGNPIECTKEEYENEIRTALQEFAGKMMEQNQDIRAKIALEEVRRLDEKHDFQLI